MRKFLSVLVVATLVALNGCAARKSEKTNGEQPKAVHSSSLSNIPLQGKKLPSVKKEVVDGSNPVNSQNLCKNAAAPLHIRTYDGSDQPMHPKVLYFHNGWNGYKYWMSYTPYPNTDAAYENPSLAVSQDGTHWTTPKGLINPVVKQPEDARTGGHNSDPHLVMNGVTMQMWYRYNPAGRNGRPNSKINQIYMISTKNGVSWSAPELVLSGSYKYLSPAILYEQGMYKVWFSDPNGSLYYTQSDDLKNWSTPETVNLSLPGYHIWHQDVIKTGRGYEIVFCAYRAGHFDQNNQCLYYAVSADGMNFSAPRLILAPSSGKNSLDNKMIYRSSIVDVDGAYQIYYSGMNEHFQWHIFETSFPNNRAKNT